MMTLAERKQGLVQQLEGCRGTIARLRQALIQSEMSEQQLIGAVSVVEEMMAEQAAERATVVTPPAPPDVAVAELVEPMVVDAAMPVAV